MKIQFHRIDTNVVVGLLVREFYCSGTDVSAKVLAMYAGTRTPSMEPQWLAAGLSQYEDMVFLIRGLFENVLKTNDSLKFAVLTGCLRVAKESIFTGLNNFKVCSITDSDFDEAFGFTESEVKSILQYYEQETHYTEVKEWYDGYRFGKADVYCPWDVLNYCRDLLKDE